MTITLRAGVLNSGIQQNGNEFLTVDTSNNATLSNNLAVTGNTILGDATTDTLNVGAGGLVKDASGNVGIGTASPATKLHVNGGLIAGVENSQTHPNTNGGGFKAQWNYLNGAAETDFYNLYSAAVTSFRFWQTTGNGTATALCDINADGRFAFNSGYGSAAIAYGCRAWVNFNGTGTVAIRASGNVSSITDNSTGNYTVNFTIAMVDANYSVSGINENITGDNSRPIVTAAVAYNTTNCIIKTVGVFNNNTNVDCSIISVQVFR